MLQAAPLALAAQSALAAHPQVFEVVLHTAPSVLVAQSLLVTQVTHSPLLVSQAGRAGLPEQSALVAQALMQDPVPGKRCMHTDPVGQSLLVAQPHCPIPHTLPLEAPAQSALEAQLHRPLLQAAPTGLLAQSLVIRQATQ
jgi:hypothetical protein